MLNTSRHRRKLKLAAKDPSPMSSRINNLLLENHLQVLVLLEQIQKATAAQSAFKSCNH
jgi:hypothetical protein